MASHKSYKQKDLRPAAVTNSTPYCHLTYHIRFRSALLHPVPVGAGCVTGRTSANYQQKLEPYHTPTAWTHPYDYPYWARSRRTVLGYSWCPSATAVWTRRNKCSVRPFSLATARFATRKSLTESSPTKIICNEHRSPEWLAAMSDTGKLQQMRVARLYAWRTSLECQLTQFMAGTSKRSRSRLFVRVYFWFTPNN